MTKLLYRSKHNCESLIGTSAKPSHYDTLIYEDTDVYERNIFDTKKTDEENVVLKFRKNVFTKEEQSLAYEALNGAAKSSKNRGTAAGARGDKLFISEKGGYMDFVSSKEMYVLNFLLDTSVKLEEESLKDVLKKTILEEDETRGKLWLKTKIKEDGYDYDTWWDTWLESLYSLSKEQQRDKAAHVLKNYISSTLYAQNVQSGIAGYIGRYARIPYKRVTAYTQQNQTLFEKSFPYLQKLNNLFETELPKRYSYQKKCAESIDPHFVINDTAFSTLTVNKNWQTNYHTDAGDLGKGFSNISALSNGKSWEGCYLVLPEYKVAIDFREGDILFVANHTAIHGNTPLEGTDNDRLSIVAYFREDLLEKGSYEYECARRDFIEDRRKNEKHPLWKPFWNGVSPGCWESEDWYSYLKNKGISDPYRKDEATLENFF